jgi:hypothetical protein
MKESVAIAKEADTKKDFSPAKSDKSIHRVRNEPERQLGSLRSVIDNIRSDGGTPSVDSIATELSSMPSVPRASVLLALQRTHGNRYVQRVAAGIQAKLKVGQPGDIYEQEADRVAEQVMRMPEPQAPQQAEEEKKEEEETLRAKGTSSNISEVTSDLEFPIQSLIGGGQPLPKFARAFFEPRFGQNFSQVRIHTDAKAAESARALNARAYAFGRDIVFGAGEYAPETVRGKRLIAHELTHVVQQGGASTSIAPMQNAVADDNVHQKNADSSAERAVADITQNAAPRLRSGLMLQRTNCCCCVDVLRIENITRIDNATHMGHSFDTVIGLSYPEELVSTPTSTTRSCTLEWWEKTNVPYAAGQSADTWHDMFALIPNAPTLSPWVNRREECLTTVPVTITDPPALGKTPGRTVARTLEFRIVVNSAFDCNCTDASKQVTATQVLTMVNANPDWDNSSFT